MHLIITIDGVDGAGKTEVVTLLSEKFDGIVIKTPHPKFLNSARRFVDSRAQDTISRSVYYLSSLKHATDLQTSDLEDSSKLIVFDRYINSTLASNVALDEIHNNGRNVLAIQTLLNNENNGLVVPDIEVFFYVDMEVRSRRLLLRDRAQDNNLDFDQMFAEKTQEFFKVIAVQHKKQGSDVLEIDTSKKTIAEVFNLVDICITNKYKEQRILPKRSIAVKI